MTTEVTKQIVFIRHGRPLSAHNNKVNAADYAKWVKDYDVSKLDPASQPSEKINLQGSYVIVSPLLRAQLSAQQYGVQNVDEVCPDLKEMDIPFYNIPLVLKTWHWVLLSRAIWFAGFNGRFESFIQAKRRTAVLAQHIQALSEEHNRIVLFGHGMTNFFTRRQLVKKGWHIQNKDSAFWGITTLTKSSIQVF